MPTLAEQVTALVNGSRTAPACSTDDAVIEAAVDQITAMARAYTRGRGFVDGEPNDDISAVIVVASARLHANVGQIGADMGQRSVRAGFQGWSMAELGVLHRYRVRAL